MKKKRYIVHVDMDAFFAAIEQRDNVNFKGKPVVIGANPEKGKGRGVVSTCSYEAREFGIHSAMPISIAYRKCPHAVFLPVNMVKYKSVSKKICNILYSFTPDIQMVSIDEAFLDITGSYHHFNTPFDTCVQIKETILKKTGLTVSIGLAPNKMTAKIASDLKKPSGIVEVKQEGILDFLWPLDIEKISGMGPKNKKKFNRFGIKTIGDLAKKESNEIMQKFGRNGVRFWQFANGIDNRAVENKNIIKSMSKEHTFRKDVSDKNKIESVLMKLSEHVAHRLNTLGFKARTVTLKIRMEDFSTYNRSYTFKNPTDLTGDIYERSRKIYEGMDCINKIRLLGVKVSNLSKNVQYTLFDKAKMGKVQCDKVQRVVNDLKYKYGLDSIHFATAEKDNKRKKV